MRTVQVTNPSFPQVQPETPIQVVPQRLWQVLCGDEGHWRAGVYSPMASREEASRELEQHTCPELFVLLSGQVTLLVWRDGGLQEIHLQPERPVLVTAPHAGYCPGGPGSGRVLVVERDQFTTTYRSPEGWFTMA